MPPQITMHMHHCMYVSFDIDFVDPGIAPATGTDVPGGLPLREAYYICEAVHDSGALRFLDLMEVNLHKLGVSQKCAAMTGCGECAREQDAWVKASIDITQSMLSEMDVSARNEVQEH